MIGRTWSLWAYRYDSGALWHIGERRWVELFGLPDPLIPVLVEEVVGDMFAPEVTHYGWMEPSNVRPTMVQIRCGEDPKRALMFLSMCFPYGLEVAVKKGTGAIVALRITEREP